MFINSNQVTDFPPSVEIHISFRVLQDQLLDFTVLQAPKNDMIKESQTRGVMIPQVSKPSTPVLNISRITRNPTWYNF